MKCWNSNVDVILGSLLSFKPVQRVSYDISISNVQITEAPSYKHSWKQQLMLVARMKQKRWFVARLTRVNIPKILHAVCRIYLITTNTLPIRFKLELIQVQQSFWNMLWYSLNKRNWTDMSFDRLSAPNNKSCIVN